MAVIFAFLFQIYKKFHQETAEFRKSHQGKWEPSVHADFCWCLHKDIARTSYKQIANRSKRFFNRKIMMKTVLE